MSNLKLQPIGFDKEAYDRRGAGHATNDIYQQAVTAFKKYIHGRVLDLGAGSGNWCQRMLRENPSLDITACDIVDDGASDFVQFRQLDLAKDTLPFPNASLDNAFAIEVLEHLPNCRHLFKEVNRVLKPGGTFCITTPSNDSLRAKVSFLLRGYFPAFCEHDYRRSGHITPIFELDLRRMSAEANFSNVQTSFPMKGNVPGTGVTWQSIFPFLKGKHWSDNLFATFEKPTL